VRLTEWIGIGKIYEALRSYGIILDHDAGYYGYGISLGLPEVSLEKIVHAYRNILDL
jgi:membrane carboxypeptidase/penicillin-binding protein PbpC